MLLYFLRYEEWCNWPGLKLCLNDIKLYLFIFFCQIPGDKGPIPRIKRRRRRLSVAAAAMDDSNPVYR